MAQFGLPELIVVLVIVVLLFGVGRVSRVGQELGTAVGALREGLKGDNEEAAAETGEVSKASSTKAARD